jgi:hypothetical protein
MSDFMLKDYINWQMMLNTDITPRYAGSHVGQYSNLFEHSSVIANYTSGDYDGQDILVYLFAPPEPNVPCKVVAITDYFGSCGGCDGWEDISDEDLRTMLISIANSARMFDTIDEAIEFFGGESEEAQNFGFNGASSPILEQLKKSGENLVQGL